MARSNGIYVKLKMPSDAQLDSMFDAVPALERVRLGDQVTRAGAAIVVKRARQLAPRSSTTGSKDKWAKSMYSGAPGRSPRSKEEIPLWKTIAYVTRRYRRGRGVSVIGPRWPTGNKAYFNTSPNGRRQVLWGRRTGVTVPQIRNWIVQAFDETKQAQLAVMKKKMASIMDSIWTRKAA